VIDISDAPASLRVLRQWLAGAGFRECGGDEESRDCIDEWACDSLRVEVRLDRGDWSLALALREMANAYHPDEWEAWFDRQPLRRHLSPLEHQVEFVVHRWRVAAARAAVDVQTAESELEAIGLDWLERRFGWRPGS
jgi:hypothetical protein